MSGKRRKYTPEFREQAARLVIETGRPVAHVAAEIGVGEQVLGRWVRLAREAAEAGDTARVLDADERAELERLRRENAELRLDRAFLKKSTDAARQAGAPDVMRIRRWLRSLMLRRCVSGLMLDMAAAGLTPTPLGAREPGKKVWRGRLWAPGCAAGERELQTPLIDDLLPADAAVLVGASRRLLVDEVVQYCAGLDVHRDTVVATVRFPQGRQRGSETKTFGTDTAELVELGDWLISHRVTRVGLESTGVYWKPVFYLLEDRIEQVWLLNAQHLKNVPGRKTDVVDSAWIAQLVEHGLVRPSFVPPPAIRELRDFTRHRRVLSEERTRMVQRLEKVLQDAGIKLTSVASTVLSKSSRAMLEAMLAGESDPVVLADLAKGRMRSKIPALTDALRGSFRVSHHGLLVRQILAHIDFLDHQLAELDEQITTLVADYEPIVERLETIPGVARKCAVSMIAEIGVDMSVFATPAHLASWAGICPGNNASGGKARSGRTRHGPVALKTVLTEAAQAAGRTKNTYLGARYHAIRGRRGTFKAVGAIRHDILIAYWHIVGAEVQYEDLGADWIARRHSREYQIARLAKQIEKLGAAVEITMPAA